MTYSIVGILAIFIHLIVNMDVFLDVRKKNIFAGEKFYLFFVLSVIAYHVTDGFWGILFDYKLATAVWVDTAIYFVAMATSILFWGMFVNKYLGTKKAKIIVYLGSGVFIAQIILIIINIFYPVLFNVVLDEATGECVYTALTGRYVMLSIQVLMFLFLSIYVFAASRKRLGSTRARYLIIGIFGLFMIAAIALQVFFPLLPLYSLGFLFGVTALHTFVIADERVKDRNELEKAKNQVKTDSLTGVMSKHAYVDYEADIDKKIDNGIMGNFAVVVFDLNDLKITNDTMGHDAGDDYLVGAAKLISDYFLGIRIYRVGGDEFVTIIEGDQFENRYTYLNAFNDKVVENLKSDRMIVVAAGLSDYDPEKDVSIGQVFSRADKEMYKRKNYLKELLVNK